jgi:hypothetical protein
MEEDGNKVKEMWEIHCPHVKRKKRSENGQIAKCRRSPV